MRIILFLLFLSSSILTQAQKFKPLDSWLQKNITQLGGHAVLMIYKDGKIIYQQSENELNRKQKIVGRVVARRQGKDADDFLQDYDANTRQRIASCSKWLSAALVMTFVDEGKLNIDDTIGKYLPVMTLHGKGKITIWQCLSHLTGIKQTGLGESDEEDAGKGLSKFKNLKNQWPSMEAAIDSIAKSKMEGEPGKIFHYGNVGLQIAAAVIEKISGKSFETLFEERIAKPCEMPQTDFGKTNVPLAAGGAWSTTNDYLHFLEMILNKGMYKGKRVLSEKSIAAMQVNYAKDTRIVYSPAQAGNWGYGFGEWVMNITSDGKTSNAVSSPGLFGSFPWVDNEKSYCAMLFTFNIKSKGRGELYRGLKELVDRIMQ
jgi:CubicO group peptidase (beta-lactamase class C family)